MRSPPVSFQLAFLVSDESSFVTGQTLLVNGGRLVR
jgi:NAD(P)-dependent dehydrogenase (short-subunit alcohol dehydrogenase family)